MRTEDRLMAIAINLVSGGGGRGKLLHLRYVLKMKPIKWFRWEILKV